MFGVPSSTWAIVQLPVFLSLAAAGIAAWVYAMVMLYGGDDDASSDGPRVRFDGTGLSGVF